MKATHRDSSPEKLTHDLQVLVEDGEDLLKSGVNRVRERAQARMSEALDAAKATGLKLKTKTLKGARSTDKAIRNHPYQSLGVVFGIGVLIGILARRR